MVNLSSDIKQFLQLSPPGVILDTDAPTFTMVYVNDAYCKLSDFTPAELIGKGLLETFPQNPDVIDIEFVEQVGLSLIECLLTKMKTVLPRQRFDVRLSGRFEIRYWQATNIPILNDIGEVRYIFHQVIDITEAYEQARKERISLEVAEAKRKELEKLFAQAPAGVVMFSGPEFVFDLVNPVYQSFFPGRELTGKPLLEALPELQGHPLVEGFKYTYTTGETYYGKEVYTQLMRVPGAPLDDSYWNFIGQARYDDNLQIDGILMFGFEVTEQVLLRKKAEASEERLNLAVENVQSGVYDTDLRTGKSIRSLRHAHIFGYPDNQEEWSLEKMLSHIVPEDLEYAQQEHISGLEKGSINVQFRIRKLDGEVRWINIIGKVNYDDRNEPVRVVGTTTDITEKIALQRQKDEFISTVSHELKTPVTSIKAYGQLLKRSLKKSGDTANGTFIEKMELQIRRLEKLIRDLLEITRIESGKLSLHPESFHFDEFLKLIINDLQLVTTTHQLIIKENNVSTIIADPTRLTQVITNLVTNAIKYSPEANKVEIAAKNENGFMICSVKDFGVGIAANEQPLIFERFHQVAGKNPNAGLSLGLGLYIAKEIVEEGGGKLWLESAPNNGSTFYFSVPLT